MTDTILDQLFSSHPVTGTWQPVQASGADLVHIAGAQEPVRDQPDDRSRALNDRQWLTVEHLDIALEPAACAALVSAVQEGARQWLDNAPEDASDADRQQAGWLFGKTRSHESPQQITHRVWLALVLHGQGLRGLRFDEKGRIHWADGITGRIGAAPDDLLDLAWKHGFRTIYTASFRALDGTIARGKGRHRWQIYRLTIDPAAAPLFEARKNRVQQRIALIVASETYATQPQLPRDFYGGNEFQQACIDAGDQPFDHLFALSPEHGVISLDDTVPSDKPWEDVLEGDVWGWQLRALYRLGGYLAGVPALRETISDPLFNWWLWLHPDSVYQVTVFGGGYPVRVLFDYLSRAQSRSPHAWPRVVLAEQRPGYVVGDFDDGLDFGFDLGGDDLDDMTLDEMIMQDINDLLEWASIFVELVSIQMPPTNEVWDIAPDEAIIPMRLLEETSVDMDGLMDLLTDMSILMERSVPMTLLINCGVAVSALLQLTHSVVHDEHETAQDMLRMLPEPSLQQYAENALQETRKEDQLCALLTLAEQLQLLNLALTPQAIDHLLVWMQTYISVHIRQQLLGDSPGAPAPPEV